jgi:hypothetical protein
VFIPFVRQETAHLLLDTKGQIDKTNSFIDVKRKIYPTVVIKGHWKTNNNEKKNKIKKISIFRDFQNNQNLNSSLTKEH